jgi:hypothetical protein
MAVEERRNVTEAGTGQKVHMGLGLKGDQSHSAGGCDLESRSVA